MVIPNPAYIPDSVKYNADFSYVQKEELLIYCQMKFKFCKTKLENLKNESKTDASIILRPLQ